MSSVAARLQKRIGRIVADKDRIELFNLDAIDLLEHVVEPMASKERVFVYLDPPYYSNGDRLYMSYHDHDRG